MVWKNGHGRNHRIFDLQGKYEDYTVWNNARFYIYDSEFADQASSLKLDLNVATTLRSHVHGNIR